MVVLSVSTPNLSTALLAKKLYLSLCIPLNFDLLPLFLRLIGFILFYLDGFKFINHYLCINREFGFFKYHMQRSI